jgi:proline iminopeptidase
MFLMAATPAREGTVTAADTELAYLWIGEGTPLVVMPGGPRWGFAHLRTGFDRLAGACSLVYYDERGSGSSPLGDPSLVSTSGTLWDLDALLDGLRIERTMLIGHSLAAHLVALYAATRPERVIALVLANPGPPLVPELVEPFGKEMAARRAPEDVEEMKRIEESAEYEARDPETVERHYRLRYQPFFRDRENALAAEFGFTPVTAKNVVEAGGRLFSDFRDHDLPEKLRSIACPTIVVHGEFDPIPVESSRFIADAIPNAELVVIPGENHFAFIENPEAFAAAIKPFLAEHAAA